MKLNFVYLLFAILCILSISCKDKTVIEVEPNNDIKFSTKYMLDTIITGKIQDAKDIDFYSINVANESLYDIAVTPVKGVNLALKIFKYQGSESPILLKVIDDLRKSAPERINDFYMTPGIWYIAVTTGDRDKANGNATDSYELTVKEIKQNFTSSEHEPNDNSAEANEIVIDQVYSGYFSPAFNKLNTANAEMEEDWYKINIIADTAPVFTDFELQGVNGLISAVEIYNDDMIKLNSLTSGVKGGSVIINNIGFKKSGNYFIKVFTPDFDSNFEVPYSLVLKSKIYSPEFELEDNNTIDNANMVQDEKFQGLINQNGDRDCWMVNAPNGGLYKLAVQPPTELDINLTILDSNQRKINEINNQGAGGVETFPDLHVNGDFYIIVSAQNNQLNSINGYIGTLTPLSGLSDFEIEPNDNREISNMLVGNIISGFTSSKKDKDYFLVKRTNRVKVILNIMPPIVGSIEVSITDPYGNKTKSVTAGNGKKEILQDYIDKKGYIIVETTGFDPDNQYQIDIKEVN